ncbi:MAG: hypothetical protein H0V82_02665 [Candidatus Protochlamydia sp.]|nr:hypothetical protein [Candidatus Protochlamydia sp.]
MNSIKLNFENFQWTESISINNKEISKENISRLLPYSFTAPVISGESYEYWMKPVGYEEINPNALSLGELPGQLEARENCFFCPETALKIAVYKKGNELVIVFGALNAFKTEIPQEQHSYKTWTLLKAGSYNLFWGPPLIFKRAHQLVQLIQNAPQFKDDQLVMVGQSFGGGLAAYTALKISNCRGICFNALPLGAWIYEEVEECKTLAYSKIIQVTVNTDWLSDNFFMRYRNFLDGYMPSLPGKRIFVPTAYPNNSIETHDYICGSFLNYLGYEVSAQPEDVLLDQQRKSVDAYI